MHPRSRAVLNFVTEEAAPSAERGCREESGHGYRPSAEGSASWPVWSGLRPAVLPFRLCYTKLAAETATCLDEVSICAPRKVQVHSFNNNSFCPVGLGPQITGSLTVCVSLLWISSTLVQTDRSLGVPFTQAVTQRPRGMETLPRFVLSPASLHAFSLPYSQTQSILTFPFFPCGPDLVTDSLYGTFLTVWLIYRLWFQGRWTKCRNSTDVVT